MILHEDFFSMACAFENFHPIDIHNPMDSRYSIRETKENVRNPLRSMFNQLIFSFANIGKPFKGN